MLSSSLTRSRQRRRRFYRGREQHELTDVLAGTTTQTMNQSNDPQKESCYRRRRRPLRSSNSTTGNKYVESSTECYNSWIGWDHQHGNCSHVVSAAADEGTTSREMEETTSSSSLSPTLQAAHANTGSRPTQPSMRRRSRPNLWNPSFGGSDLSMTLFISCLIVPAAAAAATTGSSTSNITSLDSMIGNSSEVSDGSNETHYTTQNDPYDTI